MIRVEGLTKTYGHKRVVDDLSFELEPGKVIGFLGPNGAGKSTTMRLMLGIDRPDEGVALFEERRYEDLQYPGRVVGPLLDAGYAHPKRTARNHLRMLAAPARVPDSRVDELIEQVGLTEAAGRRVGDFSLGMHQRLGLAQALLGDPPYLLLDEPTNGLDPEGIRWARELLQGSAKAGKCVFISSHLLSELAIFVDELVVIGRGRLITHTTVDEFTSGGRDLWVRVKSPRQDELRTLLVQRGARVGVEDGALKVTSLVAAAIGDIAAANEIPIHELTPVTESLEEAFLRTTHDAQEFRSGGEALPPPPGGGDTGAGGGS